MRKQYACSCKCRWGVQCNLRALTKELRKQYGCPYGCMWEVQCNLMPETNKSSMHVPMVVCTEFNVIQCQ